jgi:PAS domain S-box-containing protein
MKRKKLPAPPLSTIELPGLDSEKVRSYRAAFEGMNRLHELSTRLLEATGLGELLEEILGATIALQHAHFGNVQLYNRQTEALEIVAQRGFGPEFLDYFRAVPLGVGACGLALWRRHRVIIEDTEADPAYAPFRAAAAAGGYRAVQSTPMFSRDGGPLGMLSTHFRQPHRPSEWDLRLTDLYVQQAAGLIERKQAEEALQQSERRFVAFMDNLPGCAWMKDGCGRYTYLNKRLKQLPDYRGDCLGKTDAELLPAPIAAHYRANDQKVMTERKGLQAIEPYVAEGDQRYRLASKFPIFDPAGAVLMVGAVSIDVTEQKRAEEALRASEERLRFAAQAAGFGIYELNLVTGQAYRSSEYKALFGLRPNDEFQLDADQVPIYVHPDDRALLRNVTRESRDPRGLGAKDVEYRVVLPDGAVRWLLVRGRTFFEGEGKARRPVRSRGIALDVTERKQLEREILEISGREQRRISQDLHDGLCQQLAGIEFRNSVLVQQLANEEAKTEATMIGELIRDATRQARLLAKGLSPVQLDAAGLMSALHELTSNASKLFNVSCRFECPQPVLVADNTVATHLYRIAQEAISNAVKHGQAKFIIVSLSCSADQLTLRIWNNGVEFPAGASAEGGLGLRIMQYRAEMIGATLKISSAIDKGATVECTFKIN